MKRIIFLFVLITSISCKKEWFDYTNKYTGNFQFTTHYSFFTLSTGITVDTTYTYNGQIKRTSRGMIKIKYGSSAADSFEAEIDKNGEYSGGYNSVKFSDKNNLSIYLRTGGLGGGGRYQITGIRR